MLSTPYGLRTCDGYTKKTRVTMALYPLFHIGLKSYTKKRRVTAVRELTTKYGKIEDNIVYA